MWVASIEERKRINFYFTKKNGLLCEIWFHVKSLQPCTLYRQTGQAAQTMENTNTTVLT